MKVLLSCGKSHLRFVDFVFECYVSVLEAKFDRKKLIASLVSFVGCGVELKSVVDCFQSKCWINIWVERVFVSQCVIVVDFMYITNGVSSVRYKFAVTEVETDGCHVCTIGRDYLQY